MTTLASMPQTEPDRPTRLDRLGPVFASIWLIFLVDSVLEGWARRDEPAGVVGLLATLVFAGAYLTLWLQIRSDRSRLITNPPPRTAVAHLGGLLGLAVVAVACLGEPALSTIVFIAVSAVMVLPLRAAAPVVAVLVAGALGLAAAEGWGSQSGLVFAVLAASISLLGLRTVLRANAAQVRAEQENARLAVENERTRFARDLHDILGHSLTVITVKAELAGRLLDVDPERARAELADLEWLSRDALSDVRRAVGGYRDLTLPGELVRARAALEAAGIQARLPGSVEEVQADLRELFAWTMREGVTNVVRHSRASTCDVRLGPTSIAVHDDGTGAGEEPGRGHGLTGMRERAAAVGATVTVRRLDPGFALEVSRA